MKTRMEETVKGLPLCDEGNVMGWTTTQAVNSANRWKIHDVYSRLLIEKCHLLWDCEASALRDIQTSVDGVYREDKKKAALFSHSLDLSRKVQ